MTGIIKIMGDFDGGEFPDGWQRVCLKDICSINPKRSSGFSRSQNAPTTFVPMNAVDAVTGKIVASQVQPFSQVESGYTFFLEGDVLFAKITPCMQNGKHAIARNLIDGIGFGSTEFHIIRTNSEVLPEWIHGYLRQRAVLIEAMNHFTGAVGQQRVPDRFLRELEIPLPPLHEQKRIAAILRERMDAVERARKAAEEQLEAANALAPAYSREVFKGEQTTSWPITPLVDVAEIVSGITLGRKLKTQETHRAPYLRVANVKDGFLDLESVYEIDATADEIEKLKLKEGDLLLTEGGDPDKLGRGTFWKRELPLCLHQNHIFRVRFPKNGFDPSFISAQLASSYGKDYFLKHAKQTTGIATINQKVLGGFPLMVPAIEIQKRVVTMLEKKLAQVEKATQSIEEQLDTINSLPGALLRQAFRGEM